MKNLKLILLVSMVLLLSFQVSAERYVNYDVYERTFQSDGTYTDSTTPITNVSAVGFVCSNADCSSVSGTLWNGGVISSGSSNRLQLTFPTTLQNSNGYAVFIYKEGYRTWEQNPSWWGTDSSDPKGPYNKYLAKVEGCHAPVEQMNVLNDVQPNIPLVINMNASLDAQTYSALQNMGPVNYIPASLQNNYYSVATKVTLEIRDWNNNLAYTNSTNILIPYSSSKEVQFTWTPTIAGTYTAKIYTDITDGKCISPVRESASSGFHVLSEAPRNTCYTLINNLTTSNQFPRSGDVVNIKATKLSNYANDSYQLTSIPTNVSIEITRQSDNARVYESSNTLNANSNENITTFFGFNWNTSGLSIGWYDILLKGLGNSGLCNGLGNLDMNASESIYLNSVLVTNPICENNIVESGEQCDDGNTINGDGCSSACQIEVNNNSNNQTNNTNNKNYVKNHSGGIRQINYPELNSPSNDISIPTISIDNENQKSKSINSLIFFLIAELIIIFGIILFLLSLSIILSSSEGIPSFNPEKIKLEISITTSIEICNNLSQALLFSTDVLYSSNLSGFTSSNSDK